MNYSLLEIDLAEIYKALNTLNLQSLAGKKIMLTGATGFFGIWLIESLLYIREKSGIAFDVSFISRNPDSFFKQHPHIESKQFLEIIKTDICTLNASVIKHNYDLVFHAATAARKSLNVEQPFEMIKTIVNGTERVIESFKQPQTRIIHFSSGAVYGPQPVDMELLNEDYSGGPDVQNDYSAYAEGKRLAELYLSIASKRYGISQLSLRCFAFTGAYLPLDEHFAMGNFLKNALAGEDIVIQGDGTPLRSYMYMSDLVIWSLTLALRSDIQGAINVGSDIPVSIREAAELVKGVATSAIEVEQLKQPVENILPPRYVPSITMANSLGMNISVSLTSAISRTFQWYLDKS